MSCAVDPVAFDLRTLDGLEYPDPAGLLNAMAVWLQEQGIVAQATVEEHLLLLEYYTIKFLRVEIANPDHALWFKMRWSPDVLAWEHAKEAHTQQQLRSLRAYTADVEAIRKAEDERILSEMLAMVPNGKA